MLDASFKGRPVVGNPVGQMSLKVLNRLFKSCYFPCEVVAEPWRSLGLATYFSLRHLGDVVHCLLDTVRKDIATLTQVVS